MTAGLGGQAARGAAVTIAGQLIRVTSQLLGVVILARLLTPGDFGLVAMVVAVVGIGEILRDLGLSTSAIQSKTLSVSQRNNLFWINTGLGLGLSAICAGCAPLIAAIYAEPRLISITLVVAPIFLINGLATQYRASINRGMRFGVLVVIDTAAPTAALAISIGVAAIYSSYWALVVQILAAPLLALVLCIAFERWIPNWYDRKAPMLSLLTLGGNLAGVQILNYVSRNVDAVLVGITGGSAVLGLYDRSMQLVSQPINQVNQPAAKVALPVLSRLQDDPPKFARFLEQAQTLLLYPIAAVLALAFASAGQIVEILLGPGWEGAVGFVRLLALGAFFQAANHIIYLAFTSLGKGRQLLSYSLTTRPMLIFAVGLGAIWGPVGIASGLAIALALMWPIALLWVRKFPGINSGRLLTNSLRVIAVACAAALAGWLCVQWAPDFSPLLDLAMQAGVMTAMSAVVALAWPAVRRDFQSIFNTAKLLRK